MTQWSRIQRVLLLAGLLAAQGCGGGGVASGALPFPWPPTPGEAYPDLRLVDHRGQRVQLSSLRGKVILVEPIGMT